MPIALWRCRQCPFHELTHPEKDYLVSCALVEYNITTYLSIGRTSDMRTVEDCPLERTVIKVQPNL